MTTPASLALQEAIVATLSADPELVGLLGGARIHDAVPRNAAHPLVRVAENAVRPLSGVGGATYEHRLTLEAWSRGEGRRELHLILSRLSELLDGAALAVAGHRLVQLAVEWTDTRRQPDARGYRGTIRLRAVTEPAA